MKVHDSHYIGGRWVRAHDTSTFEVTDSATEEVIGRVPAGTASEADAAVRAARAALQGWTDTPVTERTAFLRRLAEALKADSSEIAATISAEVGMPLKLSQRIQAGLPPAVMLSFADIADHFPFEEQVGSSIVTREPVGVVACITPWNYPLHQVVAKVAPALAAGCTVVLKPSEVAPLTAFMFAAMVHEAGLPAGVFNLVSGAGQVVGEALACHPDVDMVSFTGSTRAGKRVAVLASMGVKRIALELGGKSASVVLPDADIARAVKGTVNSCYLNSGQTCSALTRMLVPEERYEEIAKLVVETARSFTPGDPRDDRAKLGPLVSAIQRDRVREYIRKGIAEGAELLLGGDEPPPGLEKGYFVSPTVFGRVQPGMAIEQEEIFGPVLSLIPYSSEEEAIAIANGTVYGLAGAVWSADEAHARLVARRMRTGSVDINGGGFNILAPFGGHKQSGLGREFGRYGFEEFLEVKTVQPSK